MGEGRYKEQNIRGTLVYTDTTVVMVDEEAIKSDWTSNLKPPTNLD